MKKIANISGGIFMVLWLMVFLTACHGGKEGHDDDEYFNNMAQIRSFGFANPSTTGSIDELNNEIVLEVPYGTDISYLVPEIEVSEGAEVYPYSGMAEDFTYPVVYTVTAEDGVKIQEYIVVITFYSNPWTVVFSDNFNGTRMDGGKWHIPTWRSSTDGTYVGQTQFRCSQNAPLPEVKNGNAIIALDTYNPTGYSFYGTDLISDQIFALNEGLLFTVRAKLNAPIPEGIVGGIFLYAPPDSFTNTLHDEIDFELLSNDTFRVHANIYGDELLGTGHPSSHYYTSGSVTDYHIYEIEWLPYQVSWYVDGYLIRTVTTESPIPTGPLYVHFNMWVPDRSFADAYNPDLNWENYSSANETFSMSIDYVTVSR